MKNTSLTTLPRLYKRVAVLFLLSVLSACELQPSVQEIESQDRDTDVSIIGKQHKINSGPSTQRTFQLDKVELFLSAFTQLPPNDTRSLWVDIRKGDGSSTVLGRAIVPLRFIHNGWVTFFLPGLTLTKGEKYRLYPYISGPGFPSDPFQLIWHAGIQDPYIAGSSDTGSSLDYAFKTYSSGQLDQSQPTINGPVNFIENFPRRFQEFTAEIIVLRSVGLLLNTPHPEKVGDEKQMIRVEIRNADGTGTLGVALTPPWQFEYPDFTLVHFQPIFLTRGETYRIYAIRNGTADVYLSPVYWSTGSFGSNPYINGDSDLSDPISLSDYTFQTFSSGTSSQPHHTLDQAQNSVKEKAEIGINYRWQEFVPMTY